MKSHRREAHLELDHIRLAARDAPLIIAWPSPGLPGGMIQFNETNEWRRFVVGLGIDSRIPDIVQFKFRRAQALYLLGWIDLDVLKAGELAALIALELTLMDRYGGQVPKKKRSFAALLNTWSILTGSTTPTSP